LLALIATFIIAAVISASIAMQQTSSAASPKSLEPVPAGSRVLIFGDSYTAGAGADNPDSEGYAHVLARLEDWSTDIAGGPGTGYLDPGEDGEGSYRSRAQQLDARDDFDLVILQGGSNDLGRDTHELGDAVRATIAYFRERFPSAQIIVLGPVVPATKQVDEVLRQQSAVAQVPYISPISEGWFAGTKYDKYTSVRWGGHPNSEGHRLLATLLAKDLAALGA
jgi:lysophospholipase L1-like esterase